VNGWMEWLGGKCPVDLNTKVYVQHRAGLELKAPKIAGAYYWKHNNDGDDIVAYKIEEPVNPEE